MSRKAILLLGMVLFVVASLAANEGHTSVETVLSNIRIELDLQIGQKIDASKVSPKLLEKLGDAWMEETIADPLTLKRMDAMMGGEDSESLAAMHRQMGYQYLTGGTMGMHGMMGMTGCGGSNVYPGGGPMMGNYGYGMPGHMNGYGWFPWGGIIIGLFFLIVIAVAVIVIVKAVKGGGTTSRETALDILKKRYAKGEITKDEYESIKKDL